MEEPQKIAPEESSGQRACEHEEYLDGWKRAKADLINYKKDEGKRLEAIIKFSQESLLRELVDVLDSFALALHSLESEAQHQKGLLLIKAQLEDTLKKYGLKGVEVVKGERFDPNIHEAIASVEEGESGAVAEVIEKGYALHGKIIRPARVKVVK